MLQYDTSLFILQWPGLIVYLLVYVNDIIVIGNNSEGVDGVIQGLSLRFSLKDLSALNYFLGVQVQHHNTNYICLGLSILQIYYVKQIWLVVMVWLLLWLLWHPCFKIWALQFMKIIIVVLLERYSICLSCVVRLPMLLIGSLNLYIRQWKFTGELWSGFFIILIGLVIIVFIFHA